MSDSLAAAAMFQALEDLRKRLVPVLVLLGLTPLDDLNTPAFDVEPDGQKFFLLSGLGSAAPEISRGALVEGAAPLACAEIRLPRGEIMHFEVAYSDDGDVRRPVGVGFGVRDEIAGEGLLEPVFFVGDDEQMLCLAGGVTKPVSAEFILRMELKALLKRQRREIAETLLVSSNERPTPSDFERGVADWPTSTALEPNVAAANEPELGPEL